ncbi:MAG: polysaccharide deacetylase family protein [Gemmataceae bacterium]
MTFDDGPCPDVTPAVLDRLRDFGARAVFFLVGKRVQSHPDLARRIVDEGHRVGNHSFAHAEPPFWPRRYRNDVLQCQRTIQTAMGTTPTLFRPPFGRLRPSTILAPRSLGLHVVGWSVDTHDWRCRSDAEAKKIAQGLNVVARDIILLHDDNPCVVPILDAILPELRRRFDLANGAENCS